MNTAELIATYYTKFNLGLWDEMCALLDEEVVHDINQGPTEVSREAFRAFLDRMSSSYGERVEELVIMVAPSQDRAAAEFWITGQYIRTDSGLPEAAWQDYRLRVGAFFEIKNGLISRVTNYYNLKDWVTQVLEK